MQNKIVSKNDLIKALSGVKKPDIDQIRSRMTVLPDGRHRLKSVGLIPGGVTACTIDGKIWIIDNKNADYVKNMVALSNVAGIKPFPCDARYINGIVSVQDISHITPERESRMRSDPAFDARVVQSWKR